MNPPERAPVGPASSLPPDALVEIRTTCADRESAEACGRALVAGRLAACVQVDGPLHSTYLWQGRIETAVEWRCTCKTTAAKAGACRAAIATMHSYRTPEILTAAAEGSAAYAAWVRESVAGDAESGDTGPLHAFTAALHARPSGLETGPPLADAYGSWSTLEVPRPLQETCFAIPFDVFLERIGRLERLFIEPDGSLVWTGGQESSAWQVDGNAWERSGLLLRIDLRGTCPTARFSGLLAACGWPAQEIMVQLVRPAVFLDLATFRRHAAARALAEPDGGGERG